MPAIYQACASFLARCAYLVDALWAFIYDVIMMSEFFKVLYLALYFACEIQKCMLYFINRTMTISFQ